MKNRRDCLKEEQVGERVPVTTLPGRGTVEQPGRSLIVSLPDYERVVLSTANFNGGLFEGPDAVFNTAGISGEVGDSLMGGEVAEHLHMQK